MKLVARGAVAALGVAALVTGCTVGGPREVPTASAPLETHCGADLALTVSAAAVAATAAGVPLLVSSDAPAGAYLNHETGGDELPTSPTTWVLGTAPGSLTLYCSTLEAEGSPVTVTVEDPGAYWSEATLDDLGCAMGAIPSWVVGPATGDTAEQAVANLASLMNEDGGTQRLTTWVPADVGYAEAATQTWIMGSDRLTAIKVDVTGGGSGFTAWPDYFCVASPWPGSAES